MTPINLPHQPPIRFAKYIISKEEDSAKIFTEFPQLPSLAMLVEAAAQSCAALESGDNKEGYLLALKNIKLHEELTKNSYTIIVSKEHDFGNMIYVGFEVMDGTVKVADGYLTVAIQE